MPNFSLHNQKTNDMSLGALIVEKAQRLGAKSAPHYHATLRGPLLNTIVCKAQKNDDTGRVLSALGWRALIKHMHKSALQCLVCDYILRIETPGTRACIVYMMLFIRRMKIHTSIVIIPPNFCYFGPSHCSH